MKVYTHTPFVPPAKFWKIADISGDPQRLGFVFTYCLATAKLDAAAIDEMYNLAKIVEVKTPFTNSTRFVIEPTSTLSLAGEFA